jgi:ABC-type bacteriocin/lantibiotic exporter with double-glycine peptidase domain
MSESGTSNSGCYHRRAGTKFSILSAIRRSGPTSRYLDTTSLIFQALDCPKLHALRLLSLMNRYRRLLAIIVGTSAATAILNTSLGALLKWLAESVQSDGIRALHPFILLFALQRLLLPISGGFTTFSSNVLAIKLESDIRSAWYSHVINLDSISARRKNSGELQKKLQDAIGSVRGLLNSTLRSTLSITLEFASIIGFTLFMIGPGPSAALALCGIAYAVHVIRATRARTPLIRNIAEADAECAAFMHDSFINAAPISPVASAARTYKHTALLNTLAGKRRAHARDLLTDSLWAAMLCGGMAYLALWWFSKSEAQGVGVTIMLSTGLAQLIAQINLLGFNYRNILHAGIDVDRIAAALAPAETPSHAGQLPIPIRNMNRIHYRIRNLRLMGEQPTPPSPISGDVVLLKGRINAMKGESGVGKSTLARIMRGEITPPPSQIFLGDADMSSMRRDALLQSISATSQESIIFNESVRSNLLYGKPDASDSELLITLSAVGLDKFRTPRGLDFVVGEKGGLLSGGERQRIAIARALLQDSDLLILDEPFTGLDKVSALDLAALIAQLSHRIYVLIILHQDPYPLFDSSMISVATFTLTRQSILATRETTNE